MLQKESKYQSRVFRDFKTLDKRNYHSIVRFYERHLRVIDRLRFDESFVMQLSYCNALFEVGRYEKHLQVADTVIELSILNNIQFHQGEDIYLKTLFQKARSLFSQNCYREAEHILKELMKLSPNHKSYPKLLKKCYSKMNMARIQQMQGTGIFTMLIAAGLLVIHVIIVKNLYPTYTTIFSNITKAGFGIGILLLVSSILVQRIMVNRRVKAFQDSIQK